MQATASSDGEDVNTAKVNNAVYLEPLVILSRVNLGSALREHRDARGKNKRRHIDINGRKRGQEIEERS